ncbi:type IV pili methyl-accepting chemotaxis transducer N-terminal domain-containing protein [Oceanobacter mangrovi]|uniref:type IV pili methyl-accepting chemotaxis transducer N-terminal domain-containing protein n=1 Tax=Oceanobacter mangrovi TaxID=2862510 RepID=UPI001C8E1051|nr:type IV pili methyl-accepting chemotaxis transducer N-terminal domain-containing protein [Oceanobacter mangrovi]
MNPSSRLIALTIAVLPSIATAESLSTEQADNISGNLCALSQRITKDYLAIGAEVRPGKMAEDMKSSVEQFESKLQQLQEYASQHKLESELENLISRWQVFQQDLAHQPSIENAPQLIADSDLLLTACNQTADAISQQPGAGNVELVAMSERGATLSQIIARDYFALYWKINETQMRDGLVLAVKDFDSHLDNLIKANGNNQQHRELLNKIQTQWQFSRSGFELSEGSQLVPVVVNATTNSIYSKMTELASAYQ